MIYFVYLLATLWSLGCFGLPLWAAWSCWDDGDNGLAVAIGLIGWPIAQVVVPWRTFMEICQCFTVKCRLVLAFSSRCSLVSATT